ncbi:ArsR/SmtB family transcription factor [Spirochaeta isovalerica]|uniref:ArsR family transcriptional regulator n=1 Tax=Spirochaeta isovalerica TaxID=150 RepID=A0A841RBW7_9SPIO|nr:metalloregulator ArsR/SmtB family transcription factor [Spirochaeta isovalerica]MBB6481186.1 ArsR family transcriptional regulator [Spirochaeta isovalerica]
MDFETMSNSTACCSLNIDGAEQERLIAISKALGNPIRFAILKYLLTHPGCITGDIVESLPIAQATTSQHLKVLKECGLISLESSGVKSCYSLNDETLKWYRQVIGEIF